MADADGWSQSKGPRHSSEVSTSFSFTCDEYNISPEPRVGSVVGPSDHKSAIMARDPNITERQAAAKGYSCPVYVDDGGGSSGPPWVFCCKGRSTTPSAISSGVSVLRHAKLGSTGGT